ncbi:MAG: hypothetical protein CVT49_03955 [candidate division Zixibacteria bacterium HGW-Zixibacteria-1]|nr:MAG: hypothetical protein CVT49_03955 [candidate division Zixibacteria bacterium HGW-Zixibacteria-1]
MKDNGNINRREFIRKAGKYSAAAFVGGYLFDSFFYSAPGAKAAVLSNIFIAKNGTPAENVGKVIDMRFGGIENFIGHDDVVVINPNGQWQNQGGSNCACCMGMIDLILNRPGGFGGEIIFCENTQFQTEGFWTVPFLLRNGPYNFNDMIAYYHSNGHSNVNGVRIWRNQDDPSNWPVISGPQNGQGWVRPSWQSPTSSCQLYLPYPVIRSPYSQRLIDLKNGVYDNGYAGQPPIRFIKMPNLNNHGSNAQQDYAGVTSAIKSFLGIAELENDVRGPFNDGHRNMHTYADGCHGGSAAERAFSAGEAVGAWMTHCRKPDITLTTAEWVGWGSRTDADATQAKTVGLCDDPVSLDYYMSKYVLWPLHPSQQLFNPDYSVATNNTRQTINGCISQGYGTANETEMAAYVYDFNAPRVFRFDIDRKINEFRTGQATQQDVLNLIEQYNQ